MTALAGSGLQSDAGLVEGLKRRDPAAVRRLTTLYNRRLYRTAREQEAYGIAASGCMRRS